MRCCDLRLPRECQSPRRNAARDECIKARLKEGDAPRLKARQAFRVQINSHHVMSSFSKTSGRDKAHISRAVDNNLHLDNCYPRLTQRGQDGPSGSETTARGRPSNEYACNGDPALHAPSTSFPILLRVFAIG